MSTPVELYIYDLSQGMASQFSGLVGFQLDGIWHTAIVVYGTEYFYGSGGVEQCPPGTTMLGQPLRKVQMGKTSVDFGAFTDYIRGLEKDKFQGNKYQLLQHNCNNFSEEVARFLTGESIPEYILELPRKVMNSPIAAMLAPIIEGATPHGDQFTGVQTGQQQQQQPAAVPSPPQYENFPHKEFILFEQKIEADKMRGKFRSLIDEHAAGSDADFNAVMDLVEGKTSLGEGQWITAKKMLLEWPRSDIFPVLDAVRFACCGAGLDPNRTKDVVATLLTLLSPTQSSSTVLQLSLKTLCNLCKESGPRQHVSVAREDLVSKINGIVEELFGGDDEVPKILQISLSSLMVNLSVILSANPDHEASVQVVSSLSSNLLTNLTNPEALYRCLVALGSLVSQDSEVKDLALALDVQSYLESVKVGQLDKLDQVLAECRRVLAD